jgi:hypothetical protein
MRDDVRVVMTAVSPNSLALEYASTCLRDDASSVLVARTSNSDALQFASERLRGEKKIVLAAVSKDGRALEYAFWCMKNKDAVAILISAAIRQNKEAMKFWGTDFMVRHS